jgi:hypothetical protein
MVHRREQPNVTPSIEIPLHHRHRREIFWQSPPLGARSVDVLDRVQHLAQVCAARASAIAAGRSGAISAHSLSSKPLAGQRIQIWAHTTEEYESDWASHGATLTDADGVSRLEMPQIVLAFG